MYKRQVYSLYDTHVAQLLDEAVYHIEHLRLGARDLPDTAEAEDADSPEAEVETEAGTGAARKRVSR